MHDHGQLRCSQTPADGGSAPEVLQGSAAETALTAHYLLRAPGSQAHVGNVSIDQRAKVGPC